MSRPGGGGGDGQNHVQVVRRAKAAGEGSRGGAQVIPSGPATREARRSWNVHDPVHGEPPQGLDLGSNATAVQPRRGGADHRSPRTAGKKSTSPSRSSKGARAKALGAEHDQNPRRITGQGQPRIGWSRAAERGLVGSGAGRAAGAGGDAGSRPGFVDAINPPAGKTVLELAPQVPGIHSFLGRPRLIAARGGR